MIVDVTMRKTVVMIVTAEIIVMKETIETEIEIIAIGIETKIAIENEKTARSLAQKRKIRRERDQNLQGRVVIGIHRREEL
jgi:recombinational DNA repair ATPase RecF